MDGVTPVNSPSGSPTTEVELPFQHVTPGGDTIGPTPPHGVLVEQSQLTGPDGRPILNITPNEATTVNFNEFIRLLLQALADLRERLFTAERSDSSLSAQMNKKLVQDAQAASDSIDAFVATQEAGGTPQGTIWDDIIALFNDIGEFLENFVNDILSAFQTTSQTLEQTETAAERDAFYKRGTGPITSPDSYVDEKPDVTKEPTGDTPPAGSSSAGMTLNLVANTIAVDLLDQLLASEDEKSDTEKLELLKLLSALVAFLLGAAGQLGITSGIPAAARLSNRLGTISEGSGPSGKAAIGLSVVQGMQPGLSIEILSDVIRILAEKISKGEVPEALSRLIRLTLLKFALAVAALGINAPGLIPQALGSLKGAPQSRILLASANRNQPLEQLDNPLFLEEFKTQLVEELVKKSNLSREEAKKAIDQAITRIHIRGAGDSPSNIVEFSQSLEDQLLLLGIDPETGRSLGALGLNILSEGLVNTPVDVTNLRENLLTTSIVDSLKKRGYSSDKIEEEAQGIAAAAIAKENNPTEASFRGSIAAGLTGLGVSPATASEISLEVVVDEKAAAGGPLANIGSDTFLTREELRAAVRDHVTKSVVSEVGKKEADKIADEYDRVLFDGETGIIPMMDADIEYARSLGTGRSFEGALGNLRDVTNITPDQFILLKAIYDPAESTLNNFLPQQGETLNKPADIAV